MEVEQTGLGLFRYILAVTLGSAALILYNALTGLHIPFAVGFLVAFVAALMVFVTWHSIITKGWRLTVLLLAGSFLIAFTAEALGVNFGWIFGRYYYTEKLGLQLFGVPFLAALAWEPILYAAFGLTDILTPATFEAAAPWVKRLPYFVWMAGIGALATTAWDMMIDPIAVNEGWWVWQDGGAYMPYVQNGVPIQNFTGWLLVAFVINLGYRLAASSRLASRSRLAPRRSLYLSLYGPLALYVALFVTSFGVTLTILRRPEVALVGMLAMGPFIVIALTNINLVRQGLATLLGAGWLESKKYS